MTTDRSSPKTDEWVQLIYQTLKKFHPHLKFAESKHWVTFMPSVSSKTVIHMNPNKNTIRVFLPFEPSYDRVLVTTPSTRGWARKYPSVFTIRDRSDLQKCVDLIHSAILRFQ